MTHPLVSAFHRTEDLEDLKVFDWYALRYLDELDEFIAECMAAESIPEFFVGFLMGANRRVYIIWLWPLSGHYEQYYWVDDGTYSRPFTA